MKLQTWLIIASLILVGGILYSFMEKPFSQLGDPNTDFMSIRLYDIDGNLIKQPEFFSIFSMGGKNIPGVYYLDYTIMVQNTGDTNTRCTPTAITPASVFDCASCAGKTGGLSAITKLTKEINTGQRSTWTSNLIPTSLMESISPLTLQASVYCEYNPSGSWIPIPGTNPKTGNFGPFSILEEYSDFTISLGVGGVSTGIVNFRTTDYKYLTGSAIGYSSICGTDLIAYGYYSSSLDSDDTCDLKMPTINYNKIMENLPGYISGYETGENPSLWKYSGVSDRLAVCDGNGENVKYIIYLPGDSDAWKVNITSNLIGGSFREKTC